MVQSYKTSYLCLRSRHLSEKNSFPMTNTRPTVRHYNSVSHFPSSKKECKISVNSLLPPQSLLLMKVPESSGHQRTTKPAYLHLRIGMASWRLCLLWEPSWAISSLHSPKTRRLQTCGTFKETCMALGCCFLYFGFQ